jgi:glycosyltransferase involved in cell wall biosynthesis
MSVYKPAKKSATPMVLYLGRLTPQKSLSVLIRSAKQIIEKVPTVEIIIAGDGGDKKKLIKLTNKLGLENKIKFLGKVTQEEKVSLYQKAWVFVNPSLIEGWGITTIEANACGTPVVASNVAGLRDAVHNPHSGILVPYGNADEFSKNIIKLIKNKKTREQMNKDSIEWAKKFNWDKSTEEVEALI